MIMLLIPCQLDFSRVQQQPSVYQASFSKQLKSHSQQRSWNQKINNTGMATKDFHLPSEEDIYL